ncbi:MAG: hypothetical protein AAF587_31110 [Bacteroidota bacterium]
MKRIVSFLLLLLGGLSLYAQPPQALNYQAIARDNNGAPLASQQISLQITVLTGTMTGTPVYAETHSTTTNDAGLFHLQIGRGNATLNLFEDIDWGAGAHFVQIELDPAGGSNYQLLGTSELLSVPYALYAENVNANNGIGEGGETPISSLDNGFADVIALPVPGTIEGFHSAIDSSGFIFIGGSFSGTTQIGSTTITGEEGWSDIFVAKYDWQGNLIWVKTGGSMHGQDQLSQLHAQNGEVLIRGYFGYNLGQSTTVTFDGTTFPNSVNNDYLMRLDQSGNIVWTKFGGTQNSSGFVSFGDLDWVPGLGIGISGQFQGQLTIDSFNLTSNPNGSDAYIGLTDENTGVFSWIDTYGDDNFDNGVTGIEFSDQNKLYAQYSSFNLQNFSPDSARWLVLSSTGNVITDKFVHYLMRPLVVADSLYYSFMDTEDSQDQLFLVDPVSLDIIDTNTIYGGTRFYQQDVAPSNSLHLITNSISNYVVGDHMYRPAGGEIFMLSFGQDAQVSVGQRTKVFSTNTVDIFPMALHMNSAGAHLVGKVSGYFFNNGQIYSDGFYLLRW